jgi:hypothetical protein
MPFTRRPADDFSEGKGMGIELFDRLCDLCKHRHPDTHPPTCDAFPKRIPRDMRLMYFDRRKPYPWDNGITFEPQDDSAGTRARLAQVRLRRPERTDQNDLDRWVRAVLDRITFRDLGQRYNFVRAVRNADTFAERPDWAQALILQGENREQGA